MHLYIEPFSGVSGDMFLGALCALTGEYACIAALPEALGLEGARVEFEDVVKNGIRCRQVRIIDLQSTRADGPRSSGDHRHRPERRLGDLLEIIRRSGVAEGAKRIGRDILTRLAEAEAEIHGTPTHEVHFHEVGAVDSLLDVVGCAVLLDRLGVTQAYSDPVCTGFGTVQTGHGLLPIPAPATAALLRGMPIFKGDQPGERATPTGAAILRFLAPSFDPPALTTTAIGYGAGQQDFKVPNVLRLSLVEPPVAASPAQEILVVECNIDDEPAEFLGADLQDDLRACGAAEVFLTPTQMKKGRPGVKLTALVPSDRLDSVADWLLENTSTIGLRWHAAKRRELPRRSYRIDTPYGPVEVKEVTTPSGLRRIKIEYASIRRISRRLSASPARTEKMLTAFMDGRVGA
jgi:uncharacterized protein (TIGR00299 family) protein